MAHVSYILHDDDTFDVNSCNMYTHRAPVKRPQPGRAGRGGAAWDGMRPPGRSVPIVELTTSTTVVYVCTTARMHLVSV